MKLLLTISLLSSLNFYFINNQKNLLIWLFPKNYLQVNNEKLKSWEEVGKVRIMPSKPYLKSEEVKLYKKHLDKNKYCFSIMINSVSSVKSIILDFRDLESISDVLEKSFSKNYEKVVKNEGGNEIKISSNKKNNSVFIGINETSVILTVAAAKDFRKLIAQEIQKKK